MNFEFFKITGLCLITPRKFGDERGFFMETFKSDTFNDAIGQNITFVQDNHSLSGPKGTVRGLHFQTPPHTQGKLIRCTSGRIIDVAVDARKNSPTYGQHISVELTAQNAKQLWVPPGFLHGFSTLEPNAEVVYKTTDYYAPECDGNILWNDPDLDINWGIDENVAILSQRDIAAPTFKNFISPFE